MYLEPLIVQQRDDSTLIGKGDGGLIPTLKIAPGSKAPVNGSLAFCLSAS